MKKYIKPETKVVKIAVHQMVAESSIKLGSSYNGTSTIESREDNSWDIWGNGSDEED